MRKIDDTTHCTMGSYAGPWAPPLLVPWSEEFKATEEFKAMGLKP